MIHLLLCPTIPISRRGFWPSRSRLCKHHTAPFALEDQSIFQTLSFRQSHLLYGSAYTVERTVDVLIELHSFFHRATFAQLIWHPF